MSISSGSQAAARVGQPPANSAMRAAGNSGPAAAGGNAMVQPMQAGVNATNSLTLTSGGTQRQSAGPAEGQGGQSASPGGGVNTSSGGGGATYDAYGIRRQASASDQAGQSPGSE